MSVLSGAALALRAALTQGPEPAAPRLPARFAGLASGLVSRLLCATSLASVTLAACGLLAGAGVSPEAFAQDKGKPVRLVVGYPPGGSSDRAARLVADALKQKLGAPVVVETKTGAGGRLAAQQIRSTPAGEDVLMIGNPAVMVVAPVVFSDVGYDALKDFVPVSQVTEYEFAVAVGTAVPVKELNHLVAWLRANAAQANFGVPATGSLPHFFALMFSDAAKVQGQVIGYRGSAPLANDLIGGAIPVAVDTLDTLLPLHEAGRLRILAVSSAKRSPLAPSIPTFAENGFEVVATGWNALFAPSSMPAARVTQIGNAVRDVMKDKTLQKRFTDAKMLPVSSSPEQTAAMLKAYREQWEPVVKRSGFKQ